MALLKLQKAWLQEMRQALGIETRKRRQLSTTRCMWWLKGRKSYPWWWNVERCRLSSSIALLQTQTCVNPLLRRNLRHSCICSVVPQLGLPLLYYPEFGRREMPVPNNSSESVRWGVSGGNERPNPKDFMCVSIKCRIWGTPLSDNKHNQVTIAWCSGHPNICGNEWADKLAKEARNRRWEFSPHSLSHSPRKPTTCGT